MGGTWMLRRADGRTVVVAGRPVRVGRDPANEVQVPDARASRLHATLWVQQGQLYVRDEGSTNGTFCNAVRVIGTRPLSPGDRLGVGAETLEVAAGPLSVPSPAGRARPSSGWLAALGTLGAIGILILVALSVRQGPPGGAASPTAAAPGVAEDSSPVPPRATAGARDALDRALRAVVKIALFDPTGSEDSWGSGSIISPDGLILTNYHVVAGADLVPGWYLEIAVMQDAQRPPVPSYRAEIVARDVDLDLAVLRLRDMAGGLLATSPSLPAVALGDSDQARIGDDLTVIGFPGIGGDTVNVTKGTISGFQDEGSRVRAWIKTDAEVGPGNSGGMAINQQGELIGIPTWVRAEDLTLGRIGVLRPINLAQSLIDQARSQADTLPAPGPAA